MRASLLVLSALAIVWSGCGGDGSVPEDTSSAPGVETETETESGTPPPGSEPGTGTETGTPGQAPGEEVENPVVAACLPRPECDLPLALPPARGFLHNSSKLNAAVGSPRHRGRDLFLRPGAAQWALGKFAYGPADLDIQEEEVDVYLLRDCKGPWKKVGTYLTTEDGDHPVTEGVSDDGGRIFVNLDSVGSLGVGRHRVRMVVAGDNSTADAMIEVLPSDARIVVSDVDGTLTTSETEAFGALFTGPPPDANPGAAELLHDLSKKGFYIFYLTARPDWFGGRTHDWLSLRGFPRGIVHTTLSELPALGDSARDFKTRELATLKAATGIVPYAAFGNTDTDAAAYSAASIPAERAYFFNFDVPPAQGVKHTDYAALRPAFDAAPIDCPGSSTEGMTAGR